MDKTEKIISLIIFPIALPFVAIMFIVSVCSRGKYFGRFFDYAERSFDLVDH